MGRKKWEAKNSKKKRPSYKHGLGRKNGKQIDPRKNPHLEWNGKNGKQIDQKKRWHLEWDGKKGKQTTPSQKRSSYKNGLERKNGKQINPKKNWHLEWDGKKGSK